MRDNRGYYSDDYSQDDYDDFDAKPQRRGGGGGYRFNERGRDDGYHSIRQQDVSASDYVSYSEKVQRLTYEDLNCDEVDTTVLDDSARNLLEGNGITELFPVQKAAYKLFIDGEELIVK